MSKSSQHIGMNHNNLNIQSRRNLRRKAWKLAAAVVGVGLFFALIHFNIAALVPLCFLGVFWIWLYERTGDLSAPILSHALFNAANFAWILLADPSTGSTP